MASPVRAARVHDAPLSVDHVLRLVLSPQVGGVALFLGVVRDHDQDAAVVSLDYTQHPIAEQLLRRCAERVAADHAVLAVAVEHRVGHLEVGDLAVVVAVAAAHRGPALAACGQLIDTLKDEVPIWKQQHFASGDVSWVGLPDDQQPAPNAEAGAATS